MPALVAGIHVFLPSWAHSETWMAGSSAGMTAIVPFAWREPVL
jgi:hypothetical protein